MVNGKPVLMRILRLIPSPDNRSSARFDRKPSLKLVEVVRVDADHPPDFAVPQPLRLAPVPDRVGNDSQARRHLFGRQQVIARFTGWRRSRERVGA